jgi:hypothetical protein
VIAADQPGYLAAAAIFAQFGFDQGAFGRCVERQFSAGFRSFDRI